MAATSEFIDAEETSVEIDSETLMNCVQNYRCIYDKSCSDYRVLQKKCNAWKKISESLNLPVDVAQKRYNNIRTVFTRHTSKAWLRSGSGRNDLPRRASWQLNNHLRFTAAILFAPKNLKAEYLRSLKHYINGNTCLLCLQPSVIFRCR